MKEAALEKIIERVCEIWGREPSEFNEDSLFADLNPKSTHYSQITTFLEDEFDTEVPFMKFRRCKSFGEAADYIVELVEG